MTPEQFMTLKVGDKIRKPNRPDQVYSVVNNDPPGNVILVPGRVTKVATRPVHADTWELDPNQGDQPLTLYPDDINEISDRVKERHKDLVNWCYDSLVRVAMEETLVQLGKK